MADFVTPEWRHHAANGRTWRLARESDLLAIGKMWAEQERRVGKQDKVDLFDTPVLLTLVAEDENGEVVEALYAEATVEFTSIGVDRAALESAPELFPHLYRFCAERGFRIARVLTPRRLARLLAPLLPGLARADAALAHFVFRIR